MKTLSRAIEMFSFTFLFFGSLITIFFLAAYLVFQTIIRPLRKKKKDYSFDYTTNKVLIGGQVLCSLSPFFCALVTDSF